MPRASCNRHPAAAPAASTAIMARSHAPDRHPVHLPLQTGVCKILRRLAARLAFAVLRRHQRHCRQRHHPRVVFRKRLFVRSHSGCDRPCISREAAARLQRFEQRKHPRFARRRMNECHHPVAIHRCLKAGVSDSLESRIWRNRPCILQHALLIRHCRRAEPQHRQRLLCFRKRVW